MTSFHQKNVFYFGDSLFSIPFFLIMNMHRKKRVNFLRWRHFALPSMRLIILPPRCVGGGLQFVRLGRQSEMALQAGQLTLCGLNERFSPPVVMFLDSHPAGDQAPVLMVQVGWTSIIQIRTMQIWSLIKRLVVKLVAHLLATAALRVWIQTSLNTMQWTT
jgi:hypothetical protein